MGVLAALQQHALCRGYDDMIDRSRDSQALAIAKIQEIVDQAVDAKLLSSSPRKAVLKLFL